MSSLTKILHTTLDAMKISGEEIIQIRMSESLEQSLVGELNQTASPPPFIHISKFHGIQILRHEHPSLCFIVKGCGNCGHNGDEICGSVLPRTSGPCDLYEEGVY